MRAMGFRGGNVTKPHKVAVMEFLDRLSDAAATIGAVNCIIREGGELVGENTDGKGFLQSLCGVTDPAGKKVVLLGSGGAARAIGVEMALAGAAEITVVNRSRERGQALVDNLNQKTSMPATLVAWEGDYQVPAETGVLINATSIGLNDGGARVPVILDATTSALVVADVVFSPPDTRLFARGPRPRLSDRRRLEHDRQPGRDRIQMLDGHRGRRRRDARGGGGVLGIVTEPD